MRSKLVQRNAIIVTVLIAAVAWLVALSIEGMSLKGKECLFVAFLGLAAVVFYLLANAFKTLRELHRVGRLGSFIVVGLLVFLVATVVGANFIADRSGHTTVLLGDLIAGSAMGTMAVGVVARWMK